MALTLAESSESHGEGLALFQLPPIDSTVNYREWIEYRPAAQITPGSALEFNISGKTTDYIDLKNTRLALKIRIMKKGTKVVAVNKVGLINLPLQSMWRQVDVEIQQQLISTTGTSYPYKAYLDILLNYGASAKVSQFQSQLFMRDISDAMDDADPDEGNNTGLGMRWQFTKAGEVLDLEGPVYVDICQQDRYLLNGLQVNFKFWPHVEPFRLMSKEDNPDYNIEIVDACLKLCSVKVNPSVQLAHAEVLEKHPAVYPYKRSVIKTFSVPKVFFDLCIDDIFQGEVPTKMIMGIVSSAAYSGSYQKNPFNFKNYNCSFAGFYLNGQSIPHKPFKMDYENKNYIEAYLSLFTGFDSYLEDRGIDISREEYASGYCLYVFDVRATSNLDIQTPLTLKGHTRLELKFSKALPENCTIIMYASFPDMVKIDLARNVLLG